MSYASNKKWRIHYPEKRSKEKGRYYKKHRENPLCQMNAGQEWTMKEDALITAPDKPFDTTLARQIGRSVEAIQLRRHRLKKLVI